MNSDSENTKKYFNPDQYNTVIVNQESKKNSREQNKEQLIELLTKTENKDTREDALKRIKQMPNALETLIKFIDKYKSSDQKIPLIAACWESGIDCSPRFSYFINLAIKEDYLCCIEALSVIDGIEQPVNEKELNDCIELLNSAIEKEKSNKKELLKQLIEIITLLKK